MKKLFIVLFILSMIPAVVYADDTEIYSVSTASIKPNVLLILDNSGSMRTEAVVGDPYDPLITYPITNSCEGRNQPCNTNTVYRFVAFGIEGMWVNHIALSSVQQPCRTTLSTTGQYQGRLSGTSGSCTSGLNRTYATGNWVNWLNSAGQSYPKIEIAKQVLRDLINSTSGVNFGLMIFNNNQGGYLAYPISDMETGSNKANLLATIGDPRNLNDLCDDVGTNSDLNLCAVGSGTWTPLAETLFEAMRYYSGGAKEFGGSGTYTTPIEYACQKNYVVLITDGMSTQDLDGVLRTICNNGDCDGDGFEPANDPAKQPYSSNGSDYLDDVAKYLSTTDLLPDDPLDAKTIGTQNVVTYTIGFGLTGADTAAVKLLDETMTNGGSGKTSSYFAGDTQELSDALAEITGEILADNTSFVAPVVPVSPENKTYSGDYVYIGFFKPAVTPFWSGNLKKYGLNLSNGVVVDKNGATALDSSGNFLEQSISYWSTTADGGIVEGGGVGEALLTRAAARNLYTYLGTNTNLTHSSNAFTTGNSALTYSMLTTANDTEKDKVINFIHGYDSFSGTPTAKREWILGDILHSRPFVVHYSTSRSVIYAGANDGMLHAFEDSNGNEIWGFIPPDLLGTLKNLTPLATGSTHPYYVDSSPKAYILDANGNGAISSGEGDKVILIFGERRGGSSYYALDVTDPDNPVYLWRIGPAISSPAIGSVWNSSDLGQSWSEPEITRVIIGSEVKYAFFIGGGYDSASEDVLPAPLSDTVGRAVYAVDVITGNKLWEYSYTTSVTNDSSNLLDNMTYAIPSSVSIIDSNGNGYADRVYVGDAGGQIWRFDIGSNSTANWTGKIIFRSNPGADSSSGRKIFYPPDYVQEIGYDILYFGTGDREHPRNTDFVDRLYAVKDNNNITTPLTESNLVDVTENLLQASSTTQGEISTILTNLTSSNGWYIKLDQDSGEKVLSPASVFAKVAYFTTYSPTGDVAADICQVNRGTARVYAVNYLTGEAVFNFDPSNDTGYSTETNTRALGNEGEILKRSDRFEAIGSGIPSGVVVIINETGESALIGVGGGLEIPEVQSGSTVIRLYWREK